jgi:hypothetical protein
LVISLLIIACNAEGGGYSGSSGGYGGSGGGVVSFGGNGLNAVGGGSPIPAAVQSTHTVEIQTVNIPHTPIQPQVIEVDANVLPLTIHFRSASSHVNVLQSHQGGGGGEVQQTSSEDEPHRLIHEVTKPIIQEVHEIITPLRRVIQEVKPVQEEIQTIVARGEARNFNVGGYGGGIIGGLGSGGYGGSAVSGGYGTGALGGSVSILGVGGAKSAGASTGSSGAVPLKKYIGDSSSGSSSKDYKSS